MLWKHFVECTYKKLNKKLNICVGEEVYREFVCLKFCVGIEAMASEIYILCDLFIVYYF